MADDTRLIERWLPIAELGIESVRERTPMTPFPAPNRLHVWWARRPLVASRAAVLASLLPADADHGNFLHVLGIHGDPVAARKRIEVATREGERLGAAAYGYRRAFSYTPSKQDQDWLVENGVTGAAVLDPTAGGGSIPFETVRVGLSALANDLNPVAALIERATVAWPLAHGPALENSVRELGARLIAEVRTRLAGVFPEEPSNVNEVRPDGYLWARTVTCPYCEGVVPLSPNWRLAPDGTGVRVLPQVADGSGTPGRVCAFEIVGSAEEQSPGTVAKGAGACPYTDCRRVIEGGAIKEQAQKGWMGEQLYAVVYKEQVQYQTITGKTRWKWERRFRAPLPEDDNAAEVSTCLAEKLPEWEAFDFIPNETYDEMYADRSRIYGVRRWRDLFSPRQLLCHGTGVEVFRELLEADRAAGELTDLRKAAYGYLAISLDKMADWNSRGCTWHPNREVVGHTFQRHDFAFKWSFAEMAPLITGLGFDWAIGQTVKCIRELVDLVRPGSTAPSGGLFADDEDVPAVPRITITQRPAQQLDHLSDASVDAVVMDPPYYDNVMYAELSDFFYVWLKRTAGQVFPELFRRRLTDKDKEAVANPARFSGQRGARERARKDYQSRMAAIFAECRRVLKPDGILTLLFTHKATGAWDALTAGLMEAGFRITASWPVNTEAAGSLHIKDKAAAKSTVFLACRPRKLDAMVAAHAAEPGATYAGRPLAADAGSTGVEETFWEDIEPYVAAAVRNRVAGYQEAGIAGVDLYLASFGPALEEFSRHWPLRRGQPRSRPARERGTRRLTFDDAPWDPYAVVPEDALGVARREVKRWRLGQLTDLKADEDLDAPTAFFVLAWDTFRAPVFAYDEALVLARAVGVDLEAQVVGRLAEKKGGDLRLWDSVTRAAKGRLGPPDGMRGMVDALHHAANRARAHSLNEAKQLLGAARLLDEPRFALALRAALEVLPPGGTGGAAAGAAADFEALENLRRLAFRDRVREPKRLSLFEDADGG